MNKPIEEELINDHELITFKLQLPDWVALWWTIITCILWYIIFPSGSLFDGVFIWGIPKSVFYLWIGGGVTIVISIVIRYLYMKHYTEMERQREAAK